MRTTPYSLVMWGAVLFCAPPAFAQSFSFSTGNPDGLIATASRPSSAGKIEIESADDFILNSTTRLDSATFTGLVTGNTPLSSIGEVRVEIYRVFPNDSDTTRTIQVPTRANSPSDVEFADRDTAASNLSFTTTSLSASFTAANSILNGINKSLNPFTGGEGPVTGQEIQFNVTFTDPFTLPADHYFFVPQVEVTDPNGNFFWLSAPKPIVSPGTAFSPDLQSWIRNENLAPDWLRIGTDITHTGPFNATFSLSGQAIPEPGNLALLAGFAVSSAGLLLRRRK